MSALVVFESMFGNTRSVAEAVAEGIGESLPVEAVEVGSAPPLQGLDVELLVAGAPTHAFGLSRPQTRADAARRAGGAVISSQGGLREWLGEADRVPLPVAGFDTHVKRPRLPGRAGRVALTQLRGMGAFVLAGSESFFVHGYEGPLYEGELDRARTWGTELARLAVARRQPSA